MAKVKTVPESTLLLHNQRMLQVMRYIVDNKIKGVRTEKDFFDKVGGVNKFAVSGAIKSGKQSFVIADLNRCCEIFGVDANFLILQGHLTMMRPKTTKSPFEQLLVAVQAVGMEMDAFTKLEETEAEKLRKSRDIIEAREKEKKENFEFI